MEQHGNVSNNMLSKRLIYLVEVDILVFLLLVSGIGVGVALWENYHPHISRTAALPTVQITTPLITPPVKDPEMTTWLSSDGKAELQMQTVFYRDDSKTYRFYVRDIATDKKKEIFTNAVISSKTMEIPFNSWSPDNSYIFLEEIRDGSKRYLVVKSSGEPFAQGEQSLDVLVLFNKQNTGYTLNEVTGWADPTLLILTTKTPKGEEGPSYWFDVSGGEFIQLSTRF